MKKLFLLIVLGVLSLTANAQTRFGYFSFDNVLKSMPDYVMAQRSIDDLRQKYDAEMKRAEDEFNSKYEEFLDVQKDLVPAILRKRQAELQEMMQKNINFKNESQRLLKQAEADAFAPVKNQALQCPHKGRSGSGLRLHPQHRRRRLPVRQPRNGRRRYRAYQRGAELKAESCYILGKKGN